ncbi:hypothetical protein H2200_003326 [Cladophialophora chaetospira]|uniref:Citrate transporter-like domain-containing protein n=1 Tax=Cladophialophora chaetospira TaxID=386627 RepID=A0AA39CLB8_9EURO|nr:hypothetical protein H2200_003326 [Cladophialophora chaetospira]
MEQVLDTGQIKEWRSVVTLIVFVLTSKWNCAITVVLPKLISHGCIDCAVLFPFTVTAPLSLSNAVVHLLKSLRIVSSRQNSFKHGDTAGDADDSADNGNAGSTNTSEQYELPINFVTAPLLAVLFLLAISAIGKQEVHDGTIGADNISPIDIMAFFLTLAYIAISIDASGLIRWLALKVLNRGRENGKALFLYLYVFFFCLGSFIGNGKSHSHPIILSGTAFLAYLTRISENIWDPRAWIHAQFTVANVVSAILVSSNPTNLVLAGAFNIKFIHYTANMIVPVVVTGIVLFPFLLYVVFPGKDKKMKMDFIPSSIVTTVVNPDIMHLKPGNPNITQGKSVTGEEEKKDIEKNTKKGKLLMAEEIMHPFIDRRSAAFGAVLMSVTLVTILVLNAVSQSTGEHPVYWVTLPAAFAMFSWDVLYGLSQLEKWREDFKNYQEERGKIEKEAEREARGPILQNQPVILEQDTFASKYGESSTGKNSCEAIDRGNVTSGTDSSLCKRPRQLTASNEAQISTKPDDNPLPSLQSLPALPLSITIKAQGDLERLDAISPISRRENLDDRYKARATDCAWLAVEEPGTIDSMDEKEGRSPEDSSDEFKPPNSSGPSTLYSLARKAFKWMQDTFPTVMVVAAHLPFALVPFALSMFVLVQGLVTKGWVPVFAYGWDHWVNETGTVGAIGGMGFLSVVLCNFAGTNIGSAILLSRVIQAWQEIHRQNSIPISDRTFWATVYSLALGVNFGAFSAVFSASLAGLLWKDILRRKYIEVKPLDFAKTNLPIIAVAMAVGCAVLVAEVYIIRDNSPYKA